MCDICLNNRPPEVLVEGDLVKVFVSDKFESMGILVKPLHSWYKAQPYIEFMCPVSKSDDNCVMAIKEKWLVKLIDLPNQPEMPRWITKWYPHSTAHVPDEYDEDTYQINVVSICNNIFKIADFPLLDRLLLCGITLEVDEGKEWVSMESIKQLPPDFYTILKASCVNSKKVFSPGDEVEFDGDTKVIEHMVYENDVVYAYFGKNKIELCELNIIL